LFSEFIKVSNKIIKHKSYYYQVTAAKWQIGNLQTKIHRGGYCKMQITKLRTCKRLCNLFLVTFGVFNKQSHQFKMSLMKPSHTSTADDSALHYSPLLTITDRQPTYVG